MPVTEFADILHAGKYRGKNENFREAMNRNASAVTEGNEEFYRGLRDILGDQRFLMAGRNQAALGSVRNITPYNCFVSGTIEDSYVDGSGSIMDRAKQAATTMRMGGGIGYDFSTLRPRGATIHKLGSSSSGPVSFMDIYNAVCLCTSSTDHRRGAQMGVLRVDHPDIEEFVRAKQNESRLRGFNISVAVTDEFMIALRQGRTFHLRWGGTCYGEIDPQSLWDTIMRSTYDWAEPGVIFIDTINRMNNLWDCEAIAATNPCGEQPLPPFGACLLGSFNLTKYLKITGLPNYVVDEESDDYYFDYDQFKKDIPPVVRAMDNVVDIASYPLYEQEQEAKKKRRMGLGVTGVANALEALGSPYGSTQFLHILEGILCILRDVVYRESIELAKEKGCFPLFSENYLKSEFVQTLPEELQNDIATYGIRNSHLLSIAPTGTISLCADNISSGIEPVTFYEQSRTFSSFDGDTEKTIADYGVQFLNHKGKTIADVTVEEHLSVLGVCTRLVDSAVSKTVNIPEDYPWKDFKEVYTKAWELGCKGITTYRSGGKRKAILTDACAIDPQTGHRDCGE